MGSLDMTIQTAMLNGNLEDLGADLRLGHLQYLFNPGPCRGSHRKKWLGSRIRLESYPGRILAVDGTGPARPGLGTGPDLIVDDGDATLYVHQGVAIEKNPLEQSYDSVTRQL